MPVWGDSLRSVSQGAFEYLGIGGTSTVIWSCRGLAADDVVELAVSDFSVVRSANSPGVVPRGMGGDNNRIWHSDLNTLNHYELSTTDFSIIRTVASPANGYTGIGGDGTSVWACNTADNKMDKLSPTDLSLVTGGTAPNSNAEDVGGTASVIWLVDSTGSGTLYELAVSDFSVIRSTATPRTFPFGVGGDASVIWHNESDFFETHELFVALSVTPVEDSLVRLEIDDYSPVLNTADPTINLVLLLKAHEWREVISTKAIILSIPGFEATPLALNYTDILIQIRGVAQRLHTPHPLLTGIGHLADFRDLEEAAILFNKQILPVNNTIPEKRARLIMPFLDGDRIYDGVIQALTLVHNPGTDEVNFILKFLVTWNPSNPALREWN